MEYIIEENVKEFINRLPELSLPHQIHLLMLAARSRKCKEMIGYKLKDLVMKREIIRFIPDWKERYFNAVSNLAVLQHVSRFAVNDKLVPPEAFGILATLSPRDFLEAYVEFEKKQNSLLHQAIKDPNVYSEAAKVNSHFFSALHKHRCHGSYFVTLDLDVNDKVIFRDIQDTVSVLKIWMVTETSRGTHTILDLSKKDDAVAFYGRKPQQGLYFKLNQKYGVQSNHKVLDIQKDSQEPIAGTLYYREKGKKHFVEILQ